MGLTASSQGSRIPEDRIRRCHCYSYSYLSLDSRCYRHSLTFNHSGDKTAINPKQKKKRSYGFATFKKKLIGKRRHTKGSDHGRCFREHFLDCPSDILKSLLGQYEALTMLKDLSVQADLARPPAKTLGQSLGDLFETESCCDIVLVYHDRSSSSQRSSSEEVRIAAHKSILMARCPYFSRHLAFHSAEEFHVRTAVSSVPLLAIRSVLKYLYTGNTDQLTQEQGSGSVQEETISMLEEEFGVPNSLESDVSFLLETLSLGDLKLVFDDTELLCHRTIVAARSPFLSRVISRKASSAGASAYKSMLEIKLDSEIIPSKYAKVLLHAIYLDNLDFRLIEQASELDADNQVQDAINLYEIGRFLEFHFLSQACEDMLMQLMSTDNVEQILSWSLNSHGSAWVGRQAQQYLEEEFFNVALNHPEVLASLNQETIVRILNSDFTQGSESEILQALIKWGEVQLKQEQIHDHHQQQRQRRPRDVCDGELKDLLSSIIDKVRVPHILSKDRTSEALDMALQRNLFSVLPNFSSQVNVATKYSPWDPRSTSGLYVRPRLFLPYFEECKKLIQDRCAQDPEIIASNSPCVSVPDTLYMLKAKHFHGSNEDLLEFQSTKVPDKEIVFRMMERMKKLMNSHSVQRAFCSNFVDMNEVMNLVELRVVREFNLPDTYSSVLQKARRRSMSTSEFEEGRSRRLSSRILYHHANQVSSQNIRVQECMDRPDVTNVAATSMAKSLNLSCIPSTNEQESPDLVASGMVMEGATALFTPSTPSSLDTWQTSMATNSPQQPPIPRQFSYCTGPSHMYL